MTVSSIEPRVAYCRVICVPLCGTKQYVTPCHGQKCIRSHLFWASLYFVYHFLFIFVNSCKFFSRCHLNPNLSLLYIRVVFIHFTFFSLLFFFPFSWILSAPCNETWRESGNLLVMQCACLHVFLVASYLGRFLRSLHYRLVIISKPLVEISKCTYRFRARAEATENAYIGTFIRYWWELYGVIWWKIFFDWIYSNHSYLSVTTNVQSANLLLLKIVCIYIYICRWPYVTG
jgi:hypothetical protein